MLTYVLLLCFYLLLHFIGDFVLQTDKMSKQKSYNNVILTQHVLVLTGILILGSLFIYLMTDKFTLYQLVMFSLINGVLHWVIDYYTSKQTSRLWKEGKVHEFFVVIGLDQMLHNILYVLLLYFFIL